MKSGDILGVKGTGLFSWGIRLFTWSSWSHVAIAYDSKTVFESNVKTAYKKQGIKLESSGAMLTPLKVFENASPNKVFHFQREPALTTAQVKGLQDFADNAVSNPAKYYAGTLAVESNNIPFFTSITRLMTVASILFSLVFMYQMSFFLYYHQKNQTPTYLKWAYEAGYHAAIAIVFALFTWFILRRILIFILTYKKFNEWLIKHNVPPKWVDGRDGTFCSNIVISADKYIGGNLHISSTIQGELRPKDVIHLAEKAFKIKKTSWWSWFK